MSKRKSAPALPKTHPVLRDDIRCEMPSWLKRAVNAGQSVEFFRLG
ncbi:conserved protein of unknown function (plasmid) [Cupriavidus taiwanensis]|uniref:Uncharacterized protein n=2 Tax=Cupriavidus taiwanensis TaxID=164546 RepID=A0A9Q7V1F1_9BURK|nr:conserved protein of unknown function [Cupriavidus taiwanensis]